MSERASAPSARIPSLDGLRAVSILVVLAAHTVTVGLRKGVAFRGAWLFGDLGSTGVSVFFGISGFVITTLLMREWRASERVDVSAFYARRAFRILPALWTFLLFIYLATPATLGELAKALLFLTDFWPTGTWRLGHTWSLGVEEQFYLLWPLTLALLGPQRALRSGWVLLAAFPVARVAAHLLWFAPVGKVHAPLHLRFDTIILGCMVAILRGTAPRHPLLRVLRRPEVAAASVVFLGFATPLAWSRLGELYDLSLGASASAFAVASVLLYSIENASSAVGRVLNSRPMVHLGAISYSLYLWQQPFFAPEVHGALANPVLAILAAFAVAELSYRFVEQPALRLRTRLPIYRRALVAFLHARLRVAS